MVTSACVAQSGHQACLHSCPRHPGGVAGLWLLGVGLLLVSVEGRENTTDYSSLTADALLINFSGMQ